MPAKLLEYRATALRVYQRISFLIKPLVRFILALVTFSAITDTIGHDARFSSFVVRFLLAAVCAVLPSGWLVFFAMALTLVHMYKASMILAVLMLIAYIILYALLMRFTPKYAIVAVLIPLLAKWGLHYAVPLVLGCMATPLAILPMLCGTFVLGMSEAVQIASTRQVGKNLDAILQLCKDLADVVLSNKKMFVMMAVFAVVIIVVYLIRRIAFDYSFEISIAVGAIVNIMGFLIGSLRLGAAVNTVTLFFMSLISCAIAMLYAVCVRFLDYSATEVVQFEDEDYYYYVKAVPKIKPSLNDEPTSAADDPDAEDEDDEDDEDDYEDEGEDEPDDTPADEYSEADLRYNEDR